MKKESSNLRSKPTSPSPRAMDSSPNPRKEAASPGPKSQTDCMKTESTKKKMKNASPKPKSKVEEKVKDNRCMNDSQSERERKVKSENTQWVDEMNKRNRRKSEETENEKKEKKHGDASASTPEFSPIVYWREPIPEVEIVDFDSLPPTPVPEPKKATPTFKKEDVVSNKFSFDNLRKSLSLGMFLHY